MEKEIKITIPQLKWLLDQQKKIVIDSLASSSGYYNKESDSGNYRMLPIDKEKFEELGMRSRFPDDVTTLEKYIL